MKKSLYAPDEGHSFKSENFLPNKPHPPKAGTELIRFIFAIIILIGAYIYIFRNITLNQKNLLIVLGITALYLIIS